MLQNYNRVPKSEINSRIEILRNKLKQDDNDGALIFSIPGLFYYSGIGLDGAIYIPLDNDPIHLVKRNLELASNFSIHNIQPFGRSSNLFETLKINPKARIMLEKDVLPASFVDFIKLNIENELIDGSHTFRVLRAVKSDYEIKSIRKAAELVDQAFEHCKEIANPEMTEISLATHLDSWLLNNGHSGFITTRAFNAELLHYSYVISSQSPFLNIHFTPISGHGLTTKYPYGPSRQKIKVNKPFFVDICGNYEGYISDSTRTFICGIYDQETKDQLESLIQIKKYIQHQLKPNKNLGELFTEVMEMSKELQIYDYFMGSKNDKSPFLGHGVGLEIDELPVFYKKGPSLVTGNVIACEPKFLIEKRKVLGIEDTFVITNSSNVILSKALDYFEI